LNAAADGRFTKQQLDLIGRFENFPIHVMRHILGDLNRYPSPDRGSDIQKAFSILDESWAKGLLAASEPFHRLGERYLEIVATAKSAGNRLTASSYYEDLRRLTSELPAAKIEENVWSYLNDQRQLEEKEEQGRLAAARQLKEVQRQREEEQIRDRLETQRQHEEEAHRAYLMKKSKLPRWLRWIW